MDDEHLTEYEKARAIRVAENQREMASLGLVQLASTVGGIRKPKAPKKPKVKREPVNWDAPPAASRRSARVAGSQADLPNSLQHLNTAPGSAGYVAQHELGRRLGEVPLPRVWRESAAAEDSDVDSGDEVAVARRAKKVKTLDDLNWHRFRSMSKAALSTRIWKIRNIPKLRSFIDLLRVQSEAELLEEAERALAQLLQWGRSVRTAAAPVRAGWDAALAGLPLADAGGVKVEEGAAEGAQGVKVEGAEADGGVLVVVVKRERGVKVEGVKVEGDA